MFLWGTELGKYEEINIARDSFARQSKYAIALWFSNLMNERQTSDGVMSAVVTALGRLWEEEPSWKPVWDA